MSVQFGAATAKDTSSLECKECNKIFRTESELLFHKEVEHVKHLALAGVA
jgi:hypothetical protein